MDQEILIVFFYDVWCAVVNAFLRLEHSLLRWQQTAVRRRFVCLYFMNVSWRQFCTKFGKRPPSDNSIRRWYAQFQGTGCVCKRKSTGRPSVTEEEVEQVRQAFVRSHRKSTLRGSREDL